MNDMRMRLEEAGRPASIASLAGKRILVTGASGFIGSHLCNRLARDGAEVYAVSRTIQADGPNGIRSVQADMSDDGIARQIFVETTPEIVFHLAGHVQGSRGIEHVRPALFGNFVTTVNLLIAAVEAGCRRVILTGSQDEPDPGEASADAFIPPSPYAASKLAANSYARMFHELYGLPVSIARIYMAYGPAQRDVNKLIPYVILSLLRGQIPRLSSGGRPLDWIYVDDVVDGLIAAAQSEKVNGQTVGLGTGVAHTAREAVEKIIALMGSDVSPAFGAIPNRQLEQARLGNVPDTQAKINWQPAISFDEGLRRTIAWYRNQVSSGAITL